MEPADDVLDSLKMKLISTQSRSCTKAGAHGISNEMNKRKDSKVPICSICYEHVKNYLECPNGSHFYCSCCFSAYVSSLCFENVEQAFQAGINMESLIARSGKIFCPGQECKSRRQHQIKGSNSSQKAFLDTQIVTHCANDVVAKYIQTVSYARVQTEAMVKIQEFVKGLSKKLPQFDRECVGDKV